MAAAVALALESLGARAQQAAPAAGALPGGGRLVAGQATISQSGNAMLIQQASGRAAIDWQSFSIGPAASVTFDQPSASAIALNRVLGADPSQIFGRLSANGQVFLLNPNGVLFARGAQVDAGGLLASTLGMQLDDFMAGRYVLRGDGATGSILNQGTLRALPKGYVALIAPTVVNEGSIEAPRGTTALVGAGAATMSFLADGLVQVRVDEGALASEIANRGAIQADGGAVLLTARARDSLGRAVVNTSGIIRARGVENVNGVIRLLGNEVIVQSGQLDASGDVGGGEILVGGNYKGGGPEHNAARTYVGSDAVLDAGAKVRGDGGKVIIWSDDSTRVYGQVNARGGAQGGNGGFVETSSKGYLAVARAPDVGAAAGNGGTWLLDPLNITVTGANNNIADVDGGADANYQPTAAGSTIAAATIVTALNGGNVILDTNVAGGEAGDITISSAISAAPGVGRSLTFNASNNINVNANIGSTSGALNIIFNPGGAVNLGTTTLNANGGAIDASGKTVNLTGGGTATINSAMSIGTLNLSGGSTLNGSGTLDVAQFNWAGAFSSTTLGGTGTLNVNGGMTMSANGTRVISGGRQVVLNGAGSWDGQANITINNANSRLTIGAAGSFDSTNDGGSAIISSGDSLGSILNQGTFKKSGGTGTTTVQTNLKFSTDGGTVQSTSGTLAINGGSIAGIPHTGTITADAGDIVSLAGAHSFGEVIVNGAGRVQLTGGAMSFDGATNGVHIQGTATLANAGASVTGAGKLTSNAGTIFELSAGGTLSNTGTSTLSGQFNWAGAFSSTTLGGAGTLNVNGGMTMSANGTRAISGGRQVVLNGAGTWDGQANITINNANSRLTIGAAGSFDSTNDGGSAIISSGDSLGSILNQGMFKKSGGTGTTTVQSNLSFSNDGGTVQSSSGTLAINGGSIAGIPHTGTFTADAGDILNLSGAHTFDETIVNGAGRVQLTGGAVSFTGTTNGVHVQGTATLANIGATVTGAGKLISDAGTTFELSGNSTQSNTGTSTLSGQFNWLGTTNATTWGGAGTVNVNGGMTIGGVSGTRFISGGRELVVNGAATWNGSPSISINNANSRLTVGATGSFDITNDSAGMSSADSAGSIVNQGVFKKSGGAGLSTVASSLSFDNQSTGAIEVATGTLDIAGAITQSGKIAPAASATFKHTGGFTNTGTIGGFGTINVGAGNALTNNGTVQPGGPGVIGTLNITGNYVQGAGGVLELDIAGPSSFDVLAVSGSATLAGTLNLNYLAGYTGFGNPHEIFTYGSRTGGFATVNDANARSLTFGANSLALGSALNTWINAAGGDWSTGVNWSLGHAPTSTEDALVPELVGTQVITLVAAQTPRAFQFDGNETFRINGGGNLNFAGASSLTSGTLDITGGTVNANGPLTLGTLTLSSGTLGGSGAVTVNTAFAWSGGTMSGATKTVAPAASLSISGSQTLQSGSFVNQSTTGLWTGNGTISLHNGSTFTNAPGAVLEAQGDGTLTHIFNGQTFNNQGIFRKTTGAGTTTIGGGGLTFNNSGTLDIQSGTVNMSAVLNNMGSVNLAAGRTLSLPSNVNGSGGGTYTLAAGSLVDLTAGTQTFTAGGDITGAGLFRVNGGTLTVNAAMSADHLAFVSGSLNGSGALTFDNSFAWSGGTMSGATKTVAPAASLSISGSQTLESGSFVNQSTNALWTGNGTISLHNGSTFTNAPGAVLEAQGDGTLTHIFNGQTFNNQGIFRKTTGAGTTTIGGGGLTFNNSGTLDIQSGTVNMSAVLNNMGSVNLAAGRTLSLPSNVNGSGGGTYTLAAGSLVDLTAGTQTFTAGGDITGAGLFRVNGGTLTVNAAMSADHLAFVSGSLNGSGALTFDNSFAWSGGTMSGATKTVAPAASLSISGSQTLESGSFVNQSTNALWTGNGTISLHNGSTFTNAPGAVLEAQGDGTLTHIFNGQTFNNQGIFRKTTGAGTTTIGGGGLTFNNSGTLDIQSGTVNMSAVLNNMGSVNLAAGRTLSLPSNVNGSGGGTYTLAAGSLVDLTAGTQTFTAGGDITGAGLFRVNGGTLTVNAAMSADHLAFVSGSLNGSGALTFDNSFAWSGGTMSGATKTVAPAASLSISGSQTLESGSFVNQSTNALWTGNGTISLHNGSTFTNAPGAVLEAQGDGTLTHAFNGQTFDNQGIFRKTTGTGTTTIGGGGLTFNNGGTLDIQSGSVNMSAAFSQSGVIDVGSGATFTRTGGFTNTGTGILRGTGTVNIGAGNTLTNNGTVQPGGPGVIGTLSVTGNYTQGAAGVLELDFASPVSFDVLAVSGAATLAGTTSLSYLGGYNGAGDHAPLTAASRSGNFGTVNDPNGLIVGYTPTAFTVGEFNVWINPAGGNWSSGANWSTGQAPAPTEKAKIPELGGAQTISITAGSHTPLSFLVQGDETLAVAGGSLGFSNASSLANGTLSIVGGTLTANAALTVKSLNLTSGTLNGTGSVTVTDAYSQGTGVMNISGAASIMQTAGGLGLGNISAASLLARAPAGTITLAAGSTVAASGTGDALQLAGTGLVNNAGATALSAPSGRWLLWSDNPAADSTGGLAFDFKQYNATYGVTAPALGAGNALLYSVAPTVTVSLTGSVSRTYDATLAAPLTLANLSNSALLAGDTPSLSFSGASYASANAGGGLSVNATGLGISVTSATKPVFGYALTSTSASGAIGTITPRPFSLRADDITQAAGSAPPASDGFVLTAGSLAGTDTLAATVSVTSTATAASPAGNYPLSPTGASFTAGLASNYAVTLLDGTLTLTGAAPAPSAPVAAPPATEPVAYGAAVNTATTSSSAAAAPPAAAYGDLTSGLASTVGLLAVPANALMIPDFGALLAEMNKKRDRKRSVLANAVRQLEADPSIADLPACAGPAGGDCIVLRNDAAPSGERASPVPKLSHLPTIERKVALLIGVADYAEPIDRLESPVKDIEEVGRIYREQLGYEVRILADADKATIVRELNRLILESGRNDSVTVMYAGHGHVVERTQRGYWIPARASAEDPRQWISNTDIGKVLENIPARQVLLVSDSCYSGTLAREARMQRAEVLTDHAAVLGRRSVTVLSSGGDEPVPDQGKDGHSVFAWHFMRQLREVKDVALGVSLHEQLAARVQADIPQQPQYGAGLASGHQLGGDYLFEVRRYE